MLVRPGSGRVHADIPGDQPGRVRPALQLGPDPRPRADALPATEQAVDRLPGPVPPGHVPPRRAHPAPPPDPVDQLSLGPLRRAARLLALGQQTAPAPPTARRSSPPARSPVWCPRGLRVTGLLGRRTIYRRPRHVST